MSGEEPIYATAEGAMRAALKAAGKNIRHFKNRYEGGLQAEEIVAAEQTLDQIDAALAMKSPDIVPVRYHQAWGNGYQACLDDNLLEQKSVLEKRLCDLPESIKSQSSKVADLTADIERLRLSIANIKNQALELVLSATEIIEGKTRLKYGNEQSRKLAVESLLKDDKLYLDNIDELGRKESALRAEQIQLEFLHNMFRAYLAIAGMQGVK